MCSQQQNNGVKYQYQHPVYSKISSNSYEGKNFEGWLSDLDSSEVESSELPLKLKSGASNLTKSQKRKRQFLWKVIGFHACSKTCGGGVQTPIVRCVREAPTRFFAPKRCAHLPQPLLNDNVLKCNQQPCPAFWKIGKFSECNCKQNSEAHQFREIKCVQEIGTGMVISVNSNACLEEAPISKKECDCPKYIKTPHFEMYKDTKPYHDHDNDNNNYSYFKASEISVVQHDEQNIAKNYGTKRPNFSENNTKSGIWLTSEWNTECPVKCGSGVQFRTIFCDRTPPNIERCNMRATPETSRHCKNEEACEHGEWFSGPWSECSGDCFNLNKKRKIYCIRDDVILPYTSCNLNTKPEEIDECKLEDVMECKPKWHYSEWSECNKPCGGGTQKRTIKCLAPNVTEKNLEESLNCKYSERPIGYRKCNSHNCSQNNSNHLSKQNSANFINRDDILQRDSECEDEFQNCYLVIKARLCNYDYYNRNCCYSCRNA